MPKLRCGFLWVPLTGILNNTQYIISVFMLKLIISVGKIMFKSIKEVATDLYRWLPLFVI